jgi:hypothetical protein
MKKRKIFLAGVAIIFGVFIFISSLFSYSQEGDADINRASSRKLYFDGRILPDHILYPVLMITDKSLLTISSGEAEIFLRIRLAQDRMITSQRLLEKGEEAMSLSTLTKSQKYLILAAHNYLSNDNYSNEAGYALLDALNKNTINLLKIQSQFNNLPTGPIGDLVLESKSLIEAISNKIQK